MREGERRSYPGKEYTFSRPLTTGQVARLCHVSTVTVRNWIKAGKLEAYTLPGGHYRITPEAFNAFLRRYSIPIAKEW